MGKGKSWRVLMSLTVSSWCWRRTSVLNRSALEEIHAHVSSEKASLFIAVQFDLIRKIALSALKDKGVLTVVLVLHASNFPSNSTAQMFISYQVSHHCLPPPYQIWSGTTAAEVLEMMKAKHIQGCMPSPWEVTSALLGPVLGFPCKKNVVILQLVHGAHDIWKALWELCLFTLKKKRLSWGWEGFPFLSSIT